MKPRGKKASLCRINKTKWGTLGSRKQSELKESSSTRTLGTTNKAAVDSEWDWETERSPAGRIVELWNIHERRRPGALRVRFNTSANFLRSHNRRSRLSYYLCYDCFVGFAKYSHSILNDGKWWHLTLKTCGETGYAGSWMPIQALRCPTYVLL